MEVDRGNFSVGITIGDGQGLSPGSGAAIQDTRAVADESCDELRGFVLNNAKARMESGRSGDIPVLNSSRGRKKSTGSEFDSFGAELGFSLRATKTDRGHGNRLIVAADAERGIESIGPGPPFDEPRRVGTTGS